MNRLKRLEKILRPRVKVVSFNDTRRKGLELYRKITAGEHTPRDRQPMTPQREELIKEVMEKLAKVRGQ